MAKKMMMMMNVLVALVALATMLHTTEADIYNVGDDMGWTIPPNGAADYAEWADENSPLYVDQDSIIFDFPVGEQDVAFVSKEDFDSCTATNPFWNSSEPARVTLTSEGTSHFIGTLAGHCAKGQKIALTWTNAPPSSMAPAQCPTPSSSTVAKVDSNVKQPRKFFSKKVGKHMNMKIVYLKQSGAI